MSSRDHQLIEDVLGGRTEAFADLIQPYQDRIYNTLYRMTGNADDAAEFFQESLLKAFRGLPNYHGESSFYTWMYRISLNVVFTSRRRRHLPTTGGERGSGDLRADLVDGDPVAQPGRRIELEEQQRIVQRILGELDEIHRAVLVLKDVEGMKYEEIAEILDVPVGTVRSRLHRARGELRARLQPFWDDGTLN